MEENNRMAKTINLLRKLIYQGNISCNEGHNKDRKNMDLTEAEDIKKRWQEYTEELYKKIFMTQITTMV